MANAISNNVLITLQDLPYFDCIATGWGKSTSNENLTDTLFKTRVLIVDNQRYADVSSANIKFDS